MIDIHSHIIYGVDDGASDMEESIEMLKIAVEGQTHKIAATSHYYRGYYENLYEDISKKVNELNEKVMELGLDIEIITGQEIMLDKYTVDLYKDGLLRGIGDTKYMLVEFPMNAMPKDALDNIYELQLLGIKPIIAHPERYAYVINKPCTINSFLKEQCLFQINTGSLKGIFGKQVKNTAEILIKHGVVNFMASDAHSTRSRCPGLSEGLKIVESMETQVAKQVVENPELMIENKSIYQNGESIKEKKSIFSFFKNKAMF